MTFTEKDFSTAPYTENGSIGSSSVVVAAHGAVVIVIIVIAHANANADDADARGARPTDRSTESRVVATTGIGARIATTRVMTRRAVTRAQSVGRSPHSPTRRVVVERDARARARAFFRHASRVLDRAFVRVEGFAVVAERDARRRARASRDELTAVDLWAQCKRRADVDALVSRAFVGDRGSVDAHARRGLADARARRTRDGRKGRGRRGPAGRRRRWTASASRRRITRARPWERRRRDRRC